MFAISASFFAVYLYATLYLQNVLGLSAIEAGLAYLPGTMIMFFVAGASAQLVERVGARLLIAGGLALIAGGMALMTLASENSSWTIILPGFLLASVGHGLLQPGARRRRDEQRPDRDERPRLRRQRHVPPGRDRGRRRRARRPDPDRERAPARRRLRATGMRTASLVCAAVCAVGAIAGWRLIPGHSAERLGAAVPEAA